VKLRCEICDGGENFETNDPYEMIEHLEIHNRALEMLIDKLNKMLGEK
jgi:hypothetical protein